MTSTDDLMISDSDMPANDSPKAARHLQPDCPAIFQRVQG